MAVEIYIGINKLDFYGDVTCAFSSGDIRNVNEGSLQTSYEIEIPTTDKNKQILKYSNEFNIFEEVTDEGRIFFNGVEVLKGIVKVLNTTNLKFKIIIQGTTWVDHFKDLKLRDLDLSSYSYVFNETNVINSWSGSGNFYRYPFVDYGRLWSQETGTTANRLPNDFVPMFRVVDIISKIFYPWTVSGGWPAIASEEYILGTEPVAADEYIENKSFHASPSLASDNQVSKTFAAGGTDILTFADAKINMLDDTDPGNNYSALNDEYTIPETGTYNFNLKVVPSCILGAYMTILGQQFRIRINHKRGSTVTVLQESDNNFVSTDILNGITYSLTTGWIHLELGDKIYATCYATTNMTNTDSSPHIITFFLTTVTTYFEAVVDRRCCYSGIGKTINPSEYMPDITQMDFIKAIKEAFGIKFFPDYQNKIIYIDTSDAIMTTNSVSLNNIDYSELPETELISVNYKNVLNLRLKKDESDKAISNYIKIFKDEPYGKEIDLTSSYAEKGIETYSNSVFGFTVSGGDPTLFLRIYGNEEYVSQTGYPQYRAYNFVPRLITWVGLTAGITWYLSGVMKTTYPKAITLDMNTIYSTNLVKTYHLIDKGKIVTLNMACDPLLIQQFITVINDITKENYRPIYKFTIGSEVYAGYLNKIEANSKLMSMELILLH